MIESSAEPAMPTLALTGVAVRFGKQPVLRDISFTLDRGELVVLLGPSGAGKSTVMRVALGLQPVAAGRVLIHGSRYPVRTGRARAAALGWLPQITNAAEPVPVLDVVMAARYRFDETRATARVAAWDALRACGVARLGQQAINCLSGGELQRVAVAAAIAQDPELLLLDEPSSHLDVRCQRDLYRLLSEQWRAGRGLLIATHDINLLHELAESSDYARVRVLGLKAGRIVFECRFDAPALATRLSALYDVPFVLTTVGRRHFFLPQ